MQNNFSYNLFVNVLTSLKSTSDLKWALKYLNTDQYTLKSQGTPITKNQKKKLLEHNIKLAIQKVIPTGYDLETAINTGMKMLEDLQSNKKNTTIRLMGYILIKILKSKLQGLYINEQKLLMMKSNFNKSPVIFVPSHRSYLDFILMAFVCFNYNIEIPYVAAATDFKNMKIMGNALKQCGAFFLHRGEKGQNVINRSVLNEYVKYLIINESSPLQFFIEGTRSRSNKSILPKLGILKCILNVLQQNEVQDITIIPISINYDRLLEDKLFGYELLGISKPKETTLRLINSIKSMDEHYGNIYINFDSPISLKEYINAIENKNERRILLTLAYEIIYRQQQNMILSYFNILAVVLIYNLYENTSKDVHLNIIIEQVNWISTLLKKCGAQIEAEEGDIKSRIIDTINQHRHFVILKNNMIQFQKDSILFNNIQLFQLSGNIKMNAETFNYSLPLILNQLYINPLLHFFVNIAFIIMVSKCRIIWKNDVLNLEGKFILLRRLFEYEFAFFDGFEKQDFKKSVLLYLQLNEEEKQLLRYLTVYPYISSYQLIYSSLLSTNQKIISEEFIYKSIHMKIEKLQTHPYGLTKGVIKSALDALIKYEMIQKYKRDDTTVYIINRTIMMELVKIFDTIIINECSFLKSKI